MNSLGEYGLGDMVLGGTLHIPDLARRLKREPAQRDFAREFDRLARLELEDDEFAIYKKFNMFNKSATDLVRFYVRRRQIRLSLEFNTFIDNATGWKEVRAFARRNGLGLATMVEHEHMDKVSYDNGKTWIVGKDHGRMERQVDCWENVTKLSYLAVRKRIAVLTQDALASEVNQYLVSVI
jgi:hypothetical protein